MNSDISIGIDIGGSHILAAGIDLRTEQIIDRSRSYLSVDNKAEKGVILDRWAAAVNQCLKQLPAEEIKGIGMAITGPFNYQTGIAGFEGNDKYLSLYGCDVAKELKPRLQQLDLPIRFINDATAFAVGEAWLGQGRGHQRQIAITLGTGMGSAFIENGFPIVKRSDVPPHGSLWHLSWKDGIADASFSTRGCVNAYHKLSGQTLPGVREIAEAAHAGNPLAKQLFETFGAEIGQFLLPWLRKFNVDLLVFGGNIAKAHALFFPALKNQLKVEELNCDLRLSELMEDAALIGAARCMDEPFWQQIQQELPVI
ncbi:MAG: ROK family protein [Bacteroidota bacterium]